MDKDIEQKYGEKDMGRDTRFLKGKNLLVVGLGETGVSVINSIYPFCSSVMGIDSNPNLNLKGKLKAPNKSVRILLGKGVMEDKTILQGRDLIIISPGVPDGVPVIKYAVESGIPIWSEVELSWSLMDDQERRNTVAVTGTNGKTTVVTLIGEILKNSGRKVELCGNIGNPLIGTLFRNDANTSDFEESFGEMIRVIEVSSFQLERIYSFKPHIGVILNITSDHLDRHKSMGTYIDLKFRLLEYQDSCDFAVLNFDDVNIYRKANTPDFRNKLKSKLITYSLSLKDGVNVWEDRNVVLYSIGEKRGKISLENINMRGRHNISNAMACIAVAKLLNVSDRDLENSIRNFKPLEHRLEYIGEINGVRCFNDSKSTNPDATIKALSDFGKEVTLILGGQDKNMDFSELIPILNQRVNHLILIGECAPKIYDLLSKNDHDYRIYRCKNLKEAVDVGFKVTRKGDVFILSPSCASMDMFKNYKERGEKFKELVMARKVSKR